jgi:hypothetical protein
MTRERGGHPLLGHAHADAHDGALEHRARLARTPMCPQCGQPMEPEGHFCAKKNGHLH